MVRGKKKKKQLSGVRSLVSTERVFLSGSSKKKQKKSYLHNYTHRSKLRHQGAKEG